MSNIIDVLEHTCGSLTDKQKAVIICLHNKNELYGIGLAVNKSAYWPLCSINGKVFHVIDKQGHKEITSKDYSKSLNMLTRLYEAAMKRKAAQ